MTYSTHAGPRKTGATSLAAKPLLAGFVLAQFCAGAFAQLAPAPTATSADAEKKTAAVPVATSASASASNDDDIVEMSPFVITEKSSKGYAAMESLSGTRLNTDLKDIGSSITEMTVDFLKDIGATSFQDALTYAPGTASYLNEINDREGNRAVSGVQYTVRGMGTTGMSRDFFLTGVPLDTYNTERLSFARGANSILYGISDPTGIIITSLAKPNMRGDKISASGDWASYGVYRVSLDANATAKLRLFRREMPAAIRFITFNEKRPKVLKPDEHEQTRYYLTAAIQPWKGATLRGNFESVKLDYSGGRMFAPYDGVSLWRDRGSNTVNYPLSSTNVPPGVRFLGQNSLTVVTAEDGSQYAMNLANTGVPVYPEVPGALESRLALTDYSIYPADKVNFLGLNNSGNKLRSNASIVVFEQLIGRNFALELGASREKMTTDLINPGSGSFFLYVDVNEKLPDGSPNPYLGVPYIDYMRREQFDDVTRTGYRATLTYSLDLRRKGKLGRILGRHRFAAMMERYTYLQGHDLVYE
jgi:hypothetical protein